MSLAELSEQEIIRRNSLNELKNLGINAYPAPEFKVTHLSKEIRDKFENIQVKNIDGTDVLIVN